MASGESNENEQICNHHKILFTLFSFSYEAMKLPCPYAWLHKTIMDSSKINWIDDGKNIKPKCPHHINDQRPYGPIHQNSALLYACSCHLHCVVEKIRFKLTLTELSSKIIPASENKILGWDNCEGVKLKKFHPGWSLHGWSLYMGVKTFLIALIIRKKNNNEIS